MFAQSLDKPLRLPQQTDEHITALPRLPQQTDEHITALPRLPQQTDE